MKNRYIIREEILQSEFDVRITPNVNRYINIIKLYNRNNRNGILEFNASLERIQKELSYRKMGLNV